MTKGKGLLTLDLLRYSGEYFFIQTVEFIETTPRPTLDNSYKDSSHTLEVNCLIAIEYQY